MSQQKIKQCISDCQNTIKQLNSMTSKVNDIALRSTLEESAHHLEMCVHECEYASKQAP